jgi:ketosteroid isomerase-like protein
VRSLEFPRKPIVGVSVKKCAYILAPAKLSLRTVAPTALTWEDWSTFIEDASVENVKGEEREMGTNPDTAVAVGIVEAWHEALNSSDIERLATLSHPDVEVGGPRGTGRGTELLQEWVNRANIRLTPLRVFHRDDTVVAQQEAEWRSAETGLVAGSQTVASIFVVRDGQVTSVVRYADLTNALQKANLDESHAVGTN